MLLDFNNADAIVSSFFPVPARDSGVVRVYKAGPVEVRIHKGPSCRAENAFVRLEWAASVWDGERCLFTAAIQRDDLRSLAPRLSVSLKELQQDYGVKGFYGPAAVCLYSSAAKESLGAYAGAMDEEGASAFLLDLALDTFDVAVDPVLVS